jgi:hemerythrin-like metal-binding protein
LARWINFIGGLGFPWGLPVSECYAIPQSLSIPYKGIDADHDVLVGILNSVLQVMQSKQPDDRCSVATLLVDLRVFLINHFRNEELEMADLEYPDLAQHKISHARFAARLNDICNDVIVHKTTMSRELLDEIFDIIVSDVIRADSGFKSFLYRKNILP